MAYVSSQLLWSLLRLSCFFSSLVGGKDFVVCDLRRWGTLACQDQPAPLLLLYILHLFENTTLGFQIQLQIYHVP